MYMKLKDGKSKVLTLSYDDGVVQDIRFMEILNRNGLKCTFNISSGKYVAEDYERKRYYGRMRKSEAMQLFTDCGHELACHGYSHGFLEQMRPEEVIMEIMNDRQGIEQDYGVIARGMAYPYGTYNDTVVDILDKCGICYSRTCKSTEKFTFPENWLTLQPTCHHKNPKLMELAQKFAEEKPRYNNENWLFYMWGHSYEFDDRDHWGMIEEFCAYMGGREDVWYATNIEIYDYVKAYESLQVSADRTVVHNPTATDVWFMEKNETYCVKAGETIRI